MTNIPFVPVSTKTVIGVEKRNYKKTYMAILVGDTLYFDANDGNDGYELWAMTIEHSVTYN